MGKNKFQKRKISLRQQKIEEYIFNYNKKKILKEVANSLKPEN